MSKAYGMDKFANRLDEIFEQGAVGKALILDAYNKATEGAGQEELFDMVNQFAYRGKINGEEALHTGGLSALEGAFVALGLPDPVTITAFEIKMEEAQL